MELWTCCCEWSWVVGKRRVYGAIYPAGIGDFPGNLAPVQRMLTREEWREQYADCWACHEGQHHHAAAT
jgi:hypothetical protein